jgi:cobalt-zinc-cadmium efflux system outer membrane protein
MTSTHASDPTYASISRIALLASGLMAAVLLTGCATTDPDAGWAEPRPLGEGLDTYRPPAKPPSASETRPEKSNVTASPTDSLTRREVLAEALIENPELQSFAYEVRAREAERVQAGRWQNPSLGFESEDITPGDPLDVNRAEQAGRLRQEFPLGGDAGRREDVAAFERNLAGWDYENTRLGVIAEVNRRFASVLAAQRRRALAGDLVALADTLYQTVARQIELGEVAEVELARVEVERAQARIEAERATERLEAARQRLAATWGADEVRFAGVQGTLEDVAPVPPLGVLRSLARQNPRIARYEDQLGRRAAQIDLEHARLIPNPSLTGGAQRFGGRGDYGLSVGLSVPLPIFDRRQGAIEAAEYRVTGARRALQETQSEVLADLEDAYRSLTASAAAVRRLRESVLPSARLAFKAFERGYRLGKFDLVRVLDAQETLFGARLQYVRALEDYRQSAARVEEVAAAPLKRATLKAAPGDAGNAPDDP